MKYSLYTKLAWSGMKKNKTLYLPYLLTCVGMVMVHYLLTFLKYSDAVAPILGYSMLRIILMLGAHVVAFFSLFFLLYTHSFLMRRRKKEYGLYHLLGMNKLHISLILFWEHLFSAVISLFGGLAFGIAFSKLAELGLINMIRSEVNYSLSIPSSSLFETVVMFSAIHLFLFLHALWQLYRSDTLRLLKSDQEGDRAPRANWPLGLAGLLILMCGYYLSLTVQNPVDAIFVFFFAVLLVICASYLLMIFGSVVACRALQKNKAYYYKANHFVSVSSMAYRMKRNGSRLATICILSTMVLVILSSTVCLYVGIEHDLIQRRYPRDINMCIRAEELSSLNSELFDTVQAETQSILQDHGTQDSNSFQYVLTSFSGELHGNEIADAPRSNSIPVQVLLVDIDDYNRLSHTDETLNDSEVLFYSNRLDLDFSSVLLQGKEFTVKKIVPEFIGNAYAAMNVVPSVMIFVPDLADVTALFTDAGTVKLKHSLFYSFDAGLSAEDEISLLYSLQSYFSDEANTSTNGMYVTVESRAESRQYFYELYGGIFYLGILLSIVFLIATVLILYYMQISEGYEDRARFGIMQKIGMTKQEIRKSINSQLLTVFAFPMLLCASHLLFAFPLIRKLLSLFDLTNISGFALSTILSFLCYCIVYVIFYRMTSNAYYKIVSSTQAN